MLKTIPVASIIFLAVAAGIAAAPMNASVVLRLDEFGLGVMETGISLATIIQLPVTVPMYFFGHGEPLGSIQSAALHSRTLWLVALTIWAALLFIRTPKPQE